MFHAMTREKPIEYQKVVVSAEVHRRAKAAAALAGKSLKEVVEKALEEFVAKQNKEIP